MGTRGTEMIAFRLPSCLGGLFLAFLLLLSVNSWGACRLYDRYAYSDFRCSQLNSSKPHCLGQFDCDGNHCWNPSSSGRNYYYVGVRGFYCGCGSGNWACCSYLECDNQCEADSASAGGIILECQYDAIESKWYRYTCHGGTNCSAGGCQKTYYNSDALCQEKYCEDQPTAPGCKEPDPEDCEDAQCCAQFNQGNVPVDTGFVGCAPPADGSQACTSTSATSATCNGRAEYSLCTRMAMWNNQTKQCGWVATNNCTSIFKEDPLCSDISCWSYTRSEVQGVALNSATKCWEGKYRELTYLECSNGMREEARPSAWQDYKVCDSYLDSLGASITESNGEGSPAVNVTISDYIQGNYPGGESVDAQGNVVQNSGGGGTGGTYHDEVEVVTTDSAGTTVVVKNSDGGDSTHVVTNWNEIRCLGQSNGYATLTNGTSTWTCPANSCSQAIMSYHMSQGSCSPNSGMLPGSNTYGNSGNNLYRGDSVPHVLMGDSIIDYTKILRSIDENLEVWMGGIGDPERMNFYEAVDAINAVIQNTHADQVHSDSGLAHDLQSAINGLSTDIGALGTNLGSTIATNTQNLASAVTSANSTAISAAAENTSAMISAMHVEGTNIRTGVDHVASAVVGVGYDIQFTLPSKMDSVFELNFDAYYDKITPFISQELGGLGDKLDSLSVEVTIDTIETYNPQVDSINNQFKKTFSQSATVTQDSLNLEGLFLSGKSWADSQVPGVDTSETWVDTTDLYDGSVDDGGYVDSLENVLPAKLDTALGRGNVQSDSAVAEVKNKMMAVAGVDSGADAVTELFSGYASGCPRNCLRVAVQGVSVLPSVTVKFDTIMCDMTIAGSVTPLDFIKTVLKLMTSMLCVIIVWNYFRDNLKGGKK